MKAAELIGPVLDHWVARAEGAVIHSNDWMVMDFPGGGRRILGNRGLNNHWSPSSDWASGGPIIERERINLHATHIEDWRAWIDPNGSTQRGDTLLIAAMRAYVASKFGEEVQD